MQSSRVAAFLGAGKIRSCVYLREAFLIDDFDESRSIHYTRKPVPSAINYFSV